MTERALTLYTIKFKCNMVLSEDKKCKDLKPDGKRVAYITSNFVNDYHKDYRHLIPVKKPRTNNKGRRKKIRDPKTKKKNNGDGTSFSSATTFGVIVDDNVYGMKLFRKNSGNIPSISVEDFDLAETVVETLFDFIKDHFGCEINLISIKISLQNFNKHYPLKSGELLNLYKIRNTCWGSSNYIDMDIAGENKKIYIHFDGRRSVILCLFHVIDEEKDRFYQAKIYPNGKIYIFGGNERRINEAFADGLIELINKHKVNVISRLDF